jgi:flagellar basal-body rod protein FlgB
VANDSTVIKLLESAMRAEGLRQQAIASNVANMHTHGYRRVDVNFEQVLNEALKRNEMLDPEKLEAEFLQPQNAPVNEFGNDVNLDNEVGEMVKNGLKHRAYMMLLKKKYQQMDEAMKVQA